MRTAIVAGNWKMNTDLQGSVSLATELRDNLSGHQGVERVLIPPFPWIVPVKQALDGSDVKVGAQNCYTKASGAFTGEVAPEMLVGLCDYVIAGHSERRHVLGETNELVAAKVNAILRAGLRAILCVGETLEEREAGSANEIVGEQLRSGLSEVPEGDMERVVIAYEPVWAIGTGKAASADDAQQMAEFVRNTVSDLFSPEVAERTRIQYGGSVNGENAGQFMACPDVDGALVGGASLNASEFAAIVRAAEADSN